MLNTGKKKKNLETIKEIILKKNCKENFSSNNKCVIYKIEFYFF